MIETCLLADTQLLPWGKLVADQHPHPVAYAVGARIRRVDLSVWRFATLPAAVTDTSDIGMGAVACHPLIPAAQAFSVDMRGALAREFLYGGVASNAGQLRSERALPWRAFCAAQRRESISVADREAMVPLDDATLIERARVEPEAFGTLYDRYVRTVFAFAFSKVRDQTLAEDLTSQTFLQALRALPRYEQRGVPFRSWLLRITANLITDQHRTAVPVQSLHEHPRGLGDTAEDLPAYDPPDPQAQESIRAWEGIEDFMGLIADLTAEQRDVLRLRFAEGLSIAEVAGQLNRTEGSVKMLLMRGLQQLRRTVGSDYFSASESSGSSTPESAAQKGGKR